MEIKFTLTGPTNYTANITPQGGAMRTINGNLQPNANPAITIFRAWNNHAGSDSVRDVFFNNLQVSSPGLVYAYTTNDTIVIVREAASGDVDGDGIPDAWEQTHFGSSTGLPPPQTATMTGR
jgi:hypothetical protein